MQDLSYQWQDGTTGTSNTFQVCPCSNGENSYHDIWVVVTDVNTGVSKSRMIHWTFYNGNGGGSCLECA